MLLFRLLLNKDTCFLLPRFGQVMLGRNARFFHDLEKKCGFCLFYGQKCLFFPPRLPQVMLGKNPSFLLPRIG